MLINKKRKRKDFQPIIDDKSSSGSEKIIIPSKNNTFEICKIKSRKALSEKLKKIDKPFTILDKNIISNFNEKANDMKEGESFEQIIDFEKIGKEKIVYLDNEIKVSKFFNEIKNTNNNIIFSSIYLPKKEEEEIDVELELFKKVFYFKNKIEKKCKVSDFCLEYKKLFENNYNDIFYKTIKNPKSYIFRYHLYTDDRIIMKLYGPRKSSKSIYLRCVLANYHCKYYNFMPTLIFDVSFIYNNIKFDNIKFQIYFYHEIFSLFSNIYDVDKFYQKINFKITETMSFIEHIIDLYFIYIKSTNLQIKKKPLFVLDNFSFFYDLNKRIEDIENNSKTLKKYNLYILHSIITQEDQEEYVNNIDKIYYMPDLEPSEFPCFYVSSFRNIYEFENELIDDEINIPSDYKQFFYENVYYLFLYLKKGMEFSEFIQEQKIEIIKEIEFFYHGSTKKRNIIQKLIDIIDNKSMINFDLEFFKNIPGNYIIINKKNNKYSFDYSFPLIKYILEYLLDKSFFIDINNPQFMLLSDAAMSINFDEFINDYFKKENTFLGYKNEEIEKVIDEYCLENNSINKEGEQIYNYNDVMNLMEVNRLKSEKLSNLIEKYKDKELINIKKLIVVFQQFNGKFVDIIFIVKKENNNNYSIVNLQIKLSNSFKITAKAKQDEPFQMTYLKQKYNIIFGINIIDAYVIYLSLFERKKKFAEDNINLCIFFSKNLMKLVDKKGNILNKFPLLKDAKVELISEFNMFINSFKNMLRETNKKKLDFIEINNKIDKNFMKVIISKEKITLEIKFMDTTSSYTSPNNKKFKPKTIYYKIVEDGNE